MRNFWQKNVYYNQSSLQYLLQNKQNVENFTCDKINIGNKLHHLRSDVSSAEQVLLDKQQIWGVRACLHCYQYIYIYDFHVYVQVFGSAYMKKGI